MVLINKLNQFAAMDWDGPFEMDFFLNKMIYYVSVILKSMVSRLGSLGLFTTLSATNNF
jgi:hypothetical protein